MTMPRTPNGFSLVEMLVALAVTGMAAVVLAAAIGQIGVVSRRGDAKADQFAEVTQAQTLLRQQIARAAPRADAQSGGSAVDFVGTTTRADWIGAPLDSAGGDALWRYRLARAGNGDVVLYHRSSLAPLAGDRSESLSGWQASPVLRGTTAIEMSYFGPDPAQRGARVWHARWAGRAGLPLLMRVIVRFGDNDRRVWPEFIVRPRAASMSSCPATSAIGADGKACGDPA